MFSGFKPLSLGNFFAVAVLHGRQNLPEHGPDLLLPREVVVVYQLCGSPPLAHSVTKQTGVGGVNQLIYLYNTKVIERLQNTSLSFWRVRPWELALGIILMAIWVPVST